jgi:hypothetical protein
MSEQHYFLKNPYEEKMSIEEMRDVFCGSLLLAIGKGEFRSEVYTIISMAYSQGYMAAKEKYETNK